MPKLLIVPDYHPALGPIDEFEPRVTYNASKPGRRFVSDGKGGGTLYITETIVRKGFRPKVVTTSIRKLPFAGG